MSDLEKQKVENYNKHYSNRKFIAYSLRFSNNIDVYLILPDDKLRPISKEEVYLHNKNAIKYVVKPNIDNLQIGQCFRMFKKSDFYPYNLNICSNITAITKNGEVQLHNFNSTVTKEFIRDYYEEVILVPIVNPNTLSIGDEIVYKKGTTALIDCDDCKSYKIIGTYGHNIIIKNGNNKDCYIDRELVATSFFLLFTKYQIVNAYTDTDKEEIEKIKEIKSTLEKRNIRLNDYLRPIDNTLVR